MLKFVLFLSLFSSLVIICLTRMPSGYSDFYARHKLWPMCLIFGNLAHPNQSMSLCFNSSEFYTSVKRPCDILGNNTNITCAGALGVSHDEEAIILMFQGTTTSAEGNEENDFFNITEQFPGGGTVHKFWYNGFLITWNAGLRDAFFSAKNANPTYELWVTGFSMGGSLAGFAAGYISQMGYLTPKDIKLVTFGQPRIGFVDFATRYPSLVPYSYRVTHNHDLVPHIIPVWPNNVTGYTHFKNEIWYPNAMMEGDPYIECDVGESKNCSNSVPPNLWTGAEHWYFNNTGHCRLGHGQ